MAKISIEPAKAKAALSRQTALERTLKTLYQDVGNVRSGLHYKISGREAIDARLREAAGQISREVESAQALRTGLEQIIARYEQTENGNTGRVAAEKTSVQDVGNAPVISQTPEQGDLRGTEGTDPGPSLTDLLKDKLCDLVGPAAAWGKDKATGILDWLGKGVESVIRFGADWADVFFGVADELGHGVSSAISNGVGWGLSLITSVFDNVAEFGSAAWSTARFWGETILEAGTSIGEGLLIGAGITAAVATLPVSVPAAAVAAATVVTTLVVDWGLDKIVDLATGGQQTSWKEAVSDFVCDTTEKVVDTAGRVITKTADTVIETGKKVVDTVADTGKKVVDTVVDTGRTVIDAGANFVTGLFSGCRWGGLLA